MPDYPTGPGGSRTRGPLLDAYAPAIDRDCPLPPRGCGAGAGEFCRNAEGGERRTPCVARLWSPACCVCLNLTGARVDAARRVCGRWVCDAHTGVMELRKTLDGALRALRKQSTTRDEKV